MPLKRKARSKKVASKSAVVLTVDEVRRLLHVGRAAAYDLARKLGVRIGDGERARLLIPRERLQEWLRGKSGRSS